MCMHYSNQELSELSQEEVNVTTTIQNLFNIIYSMEQLTLQTTRNNHAMILI